MKQTIRDKDYQIKELEINMEGESFIISFVEQENSQLKAKELILEKVKAKLIQQVGKGKEVMTSSKHEALQEKGKRKIPRTRGLKEALQGEQKQILLNEDLDLEERISFEVHQDK